MAATGFGDLHVAPHGTVWVGWGAGPRPLASGTLASECGVWMGGGGRACKPPGGLGVGPPLAQFPGSPAQPRDSCDGCAQLPAGCGRAQGSWRQKGPSRPAHRQSLLVRATENLLGRGLPPSAMCLVQVSSSAQRLGPEGSRVLERCPQPKPFLCTKSEPSSANPRRLPAWMDGPPRASGLNPGCSGTRGELCPAEGVTPGWTATHRAFGTHVEAAFIRALHHGPHQGERVGRQGPSPQPAAGGGGAGPAGAEPAAWAEGCGPVALRAFGGTMDSA